MEERKKRVVIKDSEIKAHLVGCFEETRELWCFLVWILHVGRGSFLLEDWQHSENHSCNLSSLGL